MNPYLEILKGRKNYDEAVAKISYRDVPCRGDVELLCEGILVSYGKWDNTNQEIGNLRIEGYSNRWNACLANGKEVESCYSTCDSNAEEVH